MTLEDADAMLALLGDADVMRYYPKILDRAGTIEWIKRQLGRYEKDGIGSWICEFRDSGEIAGQCGLVKQDIDNRIETGLIYLFLRKFWNQGLATEAARSCLDFGFTSLNCSRIISVIRPENEPSARVAQRLGMHREKQTMYYDLLHDVWVKENPKSKIPKPNSEL
jgi:RimJ/RimL family protein N-acetyltransferase